MSTQENDILFNRFLQDKGLLDVKAWSKSPIRTPQIQAGAVSIPGMTIPRAEDVNVGQEMDAQFTDFLRMKGRKIIGDPDVDERNVFKSLGSREPAFQEWYKNWATQAGLSQDPNPDLHKYDYRKAFLAGIEPKVDPVDNLYHWDSRFKYRQEVEGEDHPNRWVDGVDTTGALPSRQEQAAFVQKEFAPTAPRMKLEKTGEVVDSQGKVTPTFNFTRPPQVKPGMWKQALDILGVLSAEQRGLLPPDVTGKIVQRMGKDLTLGMVDIWRIAEQASGQAGLAKELEDRYVTATQVVGYDPSLGRILVEEGAGALTALVPYTIIAKAANLYGKSFIKAAPIAQRFIAAMFAGTVTGTAKIASEKLAGEPFDLMKDLPKIPTHILYWAGIEALGMTWEQVSKVVNWNLKYGGKPFGTGKRGGYSAAQGVEFETQYAPGRGPTTRTEFTAAEIRDIYTRADPNYSGAGKVPPDPGNWERHVYESITGTNGWHEAVRRGWIPPRPVTVPGEPPIITGRTVRPTGTVPPEFGGEPVPLKPEFGDVFRSTPRQYPAPGIVGTPPVTPAAPPAAMPPPGTAGGPLPGGGGTTEAPPRPSQAPPAGSAPPATGGAPRPEPGPASRWNDPSIPIRERVARAQARLGELGANDAAERADIESFLSGAPPRQAAPPPTPKPKPKIKVTPQDDGSFTVESVPEPPPPPITEKPIITPPPITDRPMTEGAPPPPVEPEAPPEARKDKALRDAIARIQADEGAPEDVRLVAQAARRSERLKKIVEGLKSKQRTDLLTGVGSDRALAKQRGWEDRPVVLFDLAGVKAANNDPKRGYKWADDKIFKPAGRVFRAFGDDRIYRRGGTADEFVLLGKSGQTLEDLTKDAELISQELDKTGVGHRRAPGKNFSETEVGMAAAKDKGRIDATTSPVVPETLEELEKFIVSDEGSIPGEPYEYMTMTGNPKDAVATLTKSDDGYFRIQRAADKTFVKSPRTGFPDFPNRDAAWKAYLEERKGGGLRDASLAEPSQRFIKSLEPPEERARRILQSRRAAQAKRGRVGMPKNPPKIWKDIMEITGQAGMRPMFTSTGAVAEEYRVNVPKFMKNKSGKPPDEIIDALQDDYGYTFGPDEDMWTLLGRAKNETPGDYGDEGAGEPGPDPEAVQAELDRQKAEYAPLMKEGETLDAFLGRMAEDAAEDGFGTRPQDIDEYISSLLKGKEGGGEPGAAGGAPFLIVTPKEAKSKGLWWPDKKMPDGKPAYIIDPSDVGPDDADVLSNQLRPTWDDKPVMQLEGWKSVIEKFMNSQTPGPRADENLLDFLQTLQRIFKETDGYGQGIRNGVAASPPFMWRASIERGHSGYTGARVFQLKLLLAYDAIARLMRPMIGNPNFLTINPLYTKPIRSGRFAGALVGGFYEPQSGHMFINPFYVDEKALWSPWAMGAFIRDTLTHEFTHFWIPTHNELFTSRLVNVQAKMADAWPHIFQIASKIIGQRAIVDKRKVYIPLGSGKKIAVDGEVIRTAGEETANLIALAKEGPGGNKKLYLAIKPEGKPGEPPAGGGPAGQPGPPSVPVAGGQSELPYPRSDAEARGGGVGVRKEPGLVGRDLVRDHNIKNLPEAVEYAMDDRSHGDEDFAISARQLAMEQFGTTDVDKIPAGDKGDAARFLQDATDRAERVGDIVSVGEFDVKEAPGFIQKAIRDTQLKAGKLHRADIASEVYRLTTGEFFPKEWQGNTVVEVQDNRQNLARFVLENYTPDKGPLENYINANKGFFWRGEEGRRGKDKLKREQQFPKTVSGGEKDFGEDKSAFAPESQPKPPRPEMPGDAMKPDLFGAEEIRVMNALRSAAQAYTKSLGESPGFEDKAVEILKARLLASSPEAFRSIAGRLGYSNTYVKKQYDAMLEILRDSPAIKEIMAKRMVQLNFGPVPSEEDLKHLAKMLRKYFSSYRGADKIIDQRNDQRVGGRMAEIFDQTIDAAKINKWLKDQPEGTNEYMSGLMRGTISGNGMEDIQNSALPDDIKQAMLNTRARVDRLSDLVIAHGGLVEETRTTFENNIGKYLAKAYRLYQDKHWSPTDAQRDAFKRSLMNDFTMTAEQADEFIEAELAYGRNDEGIRPQRSRRTRRVPTESFIRRKNLSPAWREFAGEIDRLPWLVMHTVTKQATMAHNAKFLDWISEYLPDHWTANYQEAAQRGWQNSHFPEHNYAYGKLAGKWVDPELHQYITKEFDVARSDMEEAIQKFIMNPFKWTKTIGSLPSHSRNFLSNFGFSALLRNSIMNPLNAKWYAKALDIHLNKAGSARGPWKTLIEEGVTETQFYGAEIPRMHKDVMRFDPATWPEKIWDKFVSWPIDKMGELYNFGDSLYRVSAYLKHTAPRSEGGFGETPAKAVEELNAGLQNYRKLPVVVDILRRWPFLGPFVSFKANTVKIIGNQARIAAEDIQDPATRSRGIGRFLRLALFLSVPVILSEISKKLSDVDEKQIKELERWYPEYRRNGTFLYFRGEDDKLKVFDFSFLWPTGDIERFGKSILKGDVAGAKDSLDFFSHPLLDVWSILVKGQDPQWGTKYRSIVDRAKAAAAYLYLPASMPIPNLEALLHGDVRPGNLTGPQIKAVIDAYNGQPDQYGRVKQLPEEIKNFFTGIRTWDVDPEKLLAQAAIQRNGQIRGLQGEYAKWLRKNTLAPQWEKDAKKKSFAEGVEKISAELRDIGALGRELRAGGFKAKAK